MVVRLLIRTKKQREMGNVQVIHQGRFSGDRKTILVSHMIPNSWS